MGNKSFFKRTSRYREIISTGIAFGFSDIITQIPVLKNFKPLYFIVKKHQGRRLTDYTHAQRIRMLLEELGPTFIKFGQILSNRQDILDKALIKELSLLQSNVTPFDGKVAMKIIEDSLGDKVDNVFSYFEEESKASASISQMHRATLHNGTNVAVKVKRPNIEEKIDLDIAILLDIADLLQKYVPSISIFDPVNIVEAFKNQIKNELDFSYEKNNIRRFNNFFENDKTIHIPKVYNKYCSKEVITLEYIDGVKLSHISESQYDFDNKVVLDRIVNAMFIQVFYHNFFHADPHPGNIFVEKDNVVSFIDFGMVGIITPNIKKSLSEMIYSIYTEDFTRFSYAIINMTKLKTVSNFESFNNKIYEMIQKYIDLSLEEINLEEILSEILLIINKYNLTLDPSISLMAKTVIILEAVGRDIDKNFKIIDKLKPLIKHYITEQINPKSVVKQIRNMLYNTQDIIINLPQKISKTISMIQEGSIEIKFNHQGVEDLANAFDRAVNRLSYSIVLASIIISSALIVHAKIPPFIFGDIPIIGMLGFIVSGIMGFALLFTQFIRYLRK